MAAILRTGYAVYPSVSLMGFKIDSKTKKKKFSFIKELLFGDYIKPYIENNDYVRIKVTEKNEEVEYVKVRCRNADGYIKESEMQAERILEVNFIDVGQGDGCHVVTPDDKHFLIDAGGSDNMYRYLKWRFNLKTAKVAPPPFSIVISHSDADHYGGFGQIFNKTDGTAQQFSIKKVYHNGMVEASGSKLDSLGTEITYNKHKYITDLCDTDKDYQNRLKKIEKAGNYITLLEKTSAPKEALRLGSKPIYDKNNMKMEIMGPVAINIDGKDALPVIDSNKGKTKNGHSVIIKLTIGHLRLFLGGDLNTESEYHLIHHYSGIDVNDIKKKLKGKSLKENKRKELEAQLEEAILKARESLGADIAKSCHHGSADFTSEFLQVLNPIVTVISSGDEEPHVHPRPDTLGTIGKFSRGERSLIFSTELARSSKEFVELQKSNSTKKRERTVTVYGMINVRTDGEKVIIAQKLEKPAAGRSWDIHKLEWNEEKGAFEYNQYLKYE
ncbi:MAG: MBL fold metallo-hydrolase [Bacteroidales bacterium]|nr:MBL fold metallo-hydrolase [Bacteroidales bacterium]